MSKTFEYKQICFLVMSLKILYRSFISFSSISISNRLWYSSAIQTLLILFSFAYQFLEIPFFLFFSWCSFYCHHCTSILYQLRILSWQTFAVKKYVFFLGIINWNSMYEQRNKKIENKFFFSLWKLFLQRKVTENRSVYPT